MDPLFSIHLLRVECPECLELTAYREFQESQALRVEMVQREPRVTWERKVKPEKLEQPAGREKAVTMTLLETMRMESEIRHRQWPISRWGE